MSHSRHSHNSRHNISSVSKPTVTQSLFVKVKYNNSLPDIPFDPKFLVNPLSINRYVDYETSSLEQNSKHDLLVPNDLGVDINLILPDRYAIPDNPILDPEDDRLINDDEPLPQSTKKSARDKPHSQLHNKVVPWLKKTEYISTEYNRYGSSNEKSETKVGYALRKSMKEDTIYLDKESQIKAINRTFDAAQKPIDRHPTKPDVYAEKVSPLFPDFDLWKHIFAHVKFDHEPADQSKADQMAQAIIKGGYDSESQENFIVYFLPTEVTMADRLLDQNNGLDYTEGKEYEYKSTREYTFSAKQNNNDDFFFSFRDDNVYYNRLTLDVTLKKRRNKNQNSVASTLVVKHRDIDSEELETQREKLTQLEKPLPQEEPGIDLTAQSLEQAYEEMTQEKREPSVSGDPSSPDEEGDDDNSVSSQAESSSSSQSSSAASSSSSEDNSDEADSD